MFDQTCFALQSNINNTKNQKLLIVKIVAYPQQPNHQRIQQQV